MTSRPPSTPYPRHPGDGLWDADEARLSATPHEVTPISLGESSIAAASNDAGYTGGKLWGMYGDTTTVANPYGSQAGEAWASGFTGSTSTIVGVIDTGIDYTHPDLYANVWLNQREIPYTLRVSLSDVDMDGLISLRDLNNAANADLVLDSNGNGFIDARDLLTDARWENGIDDNSDGFVDDLIGWDFVNNDNDPFDDNGHGTHVSGTIGAMGGNDIGVAGVNWAIQIVPIKFLGANGSGSLLNAIRAVDYFTNLATHASAGENYVATNNSWAGGGYVQLLSDAIVRAAQQDVLFVAAAGNVSANNDIVTSYPANYSTMAAAGYEAVISVASLTSTGELSNFSNYGETTVDLAAPGSSIYSTVRGGGYGTLSGTSMAAPHVTGAVALYASAHPTASAAEIREALLTSVAPTPSLVGVVASGGRLDIGQLMATDPITPDTPPPADKIAGNATTTETLVPGGTHGSVIDFAGDQDWYRVDLAAGNTYQIDLGASAGSTLDSYLRVLDASGTELGQNNNTNGLNARLSVQALSSGTYFISAEGNAGSAGAYDLSISAGTPVSRLSIAAVNPAGVLEGNARSTNRRFLVTRTGNTAQEASATWTVTGTGTNSADAQDFAAKAMPSGVVRFRAGETSRTVDVAVAGDTTFEADETFAVTLSNASWGSMIGSAQATGTILNDESVISIAAVDAERAEGNWGATTFSFIISRTGGALMSSRVAWSVAGTGADAASARDFSGNRLPSGSVAFRKGETERRITFQAAGDRTVEANESFVVTLKNPAAGASLGIATASGTILDDDGTVLSGAIGARSVLSPAAMTFIAPTEGETVAASGLTPADSTHAGSESLPALLVDPLTVALDLKGILPEPQATVDVASTPVGGGVGHDAVQNVVLAITRPLGLT